MDAIELEQWQHIAGTYDQDSGDIELYVNGEVAGTTGHSGDLIDNDMDIINVHLIVFFCRCRR